MALIFWLWHKIQSLLICGLQMLNKLWNIIAVQNHDALVHSCDLLDANVSFGSNIYLCSVSWFYFACLHKLDMYANDA